MPPTAVIIALFRLSEPIEFIPRVGGLGLGATPKAPEKKPGRIRKPGETERKVGGMLGISLLHFALTDHKYNA